MRFYFAFFFVVVQCSECSVGFLIAMVFVFSVNAKTVYGDKLNLLLYKDKIIESCIIFVWPMSNVYPIQITFDFQKCLLDLIQINDIIFVS